MFASAVHRYITWNSPIVRNSVPSDLCIDSVSSDLYIDSVPSDLYIEHAWGASLGQPGSQWLNHVNNQKSYHAKSSIHFICTENIQSFHLNQKAFHLNHSFHSNKKTFYLNKKTLNHDFQVIKAFETI